MNDRCGEDTEVGLLEGSTTWINTVDVQGKRGERKKKKLLTSMNQNWFQMQSWIKRYNTTSHGYKLILMTKPFSLWWSKRGLWLTVAGCNALKPMELPEFHRIKRKKKTKKKTRSRTPFLRNTKHLFVMNEQNWLISSGVTNPVCPSISGI